MSDVIEPDPPEGHMGEHEDLTPSGEPAPEEAEERDAGQDEPPAADPVTGSTPRDPSVDESGLPPAGKDPMAGESPSS